MKRILQVSQLLAECTFPDLPFFLYPKVMYIPAVPTTPMNKMYVQIQKDCFLKSISPPDFPKGSEAFHGIANKAGDLLSTMGVQAMGLSVM